MLRASGKPPKNNRRVLNPKLPALKPQKAEQKRQTESPFKKKPVRLWDLKKTNSKMIVSNLKVKIKMKSIPIIANPESKTINPTLLSRSNILLSPILYLFKTESNKKQKFSAWAQENHDDDEP
jgi:hypothetical protein